MKLLTTHTAEQPYVPLVGQGHNDTDTPPKWHRQWLL